MISYRGTEPDIKMTQEVYNELRKYAIASSARMLAMFLKIDKSGSAYRIKDVYIPEQNCNTAHCIIADAELRKLGVEYIGLCRTGNGTKIDFSNDDLDLFDKSFIGVDNYVCMNFTLGGNMSADIIDGNITFEDVHIYVTPNFKKEELDATKDFLDERVKDWTYKDGYTARERGTYVQTSLLTEHIGWRDVV